MFVECSEDVELDSDRIEATVHCHETLSSVDVHVATDVLNKHFYRSPGQMCLFFRLPKQMVHCAYCLLRSIHLAIKTTKRFL